MTDVVPVLITGAVTVFGWYATYAYAKKREDYTRRLDLLLKLRTRQIEELYGPLLSLIEQIFNVYEVQRILFQGASRSAEDKQRTEDFVWQHYFSPLHQEIGSLLKTKLYLLEGGRLPNSFTEYLKHATQEAIQHRLWSELGISTSGVSGSEWPRGFYDDVKRTVDRLMGEYQAGLARLAPRGLNR